MLPGHKAVIAFERYKYLKKQAMGWHQTKDIYIKELIDLLGLECLGFILNDLSITHGGHNTTICLDMIEAMHKRGLIPYSPYSPVTVTLRSPQKIPGNKGSSYFSTEVTQVLHQVEPKPDAIEQIKQWAIEEGYYDE